MSDMLGFCPDMWPAPIWCVQAVWRSYQVKQGDIIICPNCDARIDRNQNFCQSCGTRLEVVETLRQQDIMRCPNCDALIVRDQYFCTSCGTQLDVEETATDLSEEERRRVYSEEKVRGEARKKIEAEDQKKKFPFGVEREERNVQHLASWTTQTLQRIGDSLTESEESKRVLMIVFGSVGLLLIGMVAWVVLGSVDPTLATPSTPQLAHIPKDAPTRTP